MKRVQVSVPASVANLGPGFDSLGLALQLRNQLTVETTETGLEIRVEGEGQHRLPTDGDNLIARSLLHLYQAHGVEPPSLSLTCQNRIPLAAGLGSSAAAVVAGLLAADALMGSGLPPEELLAHAGQLEGHLDNAAAALLGGLVIVGPGEPLPLVRRLEPAVEQLAVVVPQLELSTQQMRSLLPKAVPLREAAFNIGRTALTVEALRTGDLELLGRAMEDHLHQPYRLPLIKGYIQAAAAARQAGAVSVALAGAGPGMLAFGQRDLPAIAEAMVAVFSDLGVKARPLVLQVDPAGAQVRSV